MAIPFARALDVIGVYSLLRIEHRIGKMHEHRTKLHQDGIFLKDADKSQSWWSTQYQLAQINVLRDLLARSVEDYFGEIEIQFDEASSVELCNKSAQLRDAMVDVLNRVAMDDAARMETMNRIYTTSWILMRVPVEQVELWRCYNRIAHGAADAPDPMDTNEQPRRDAEPAEPAEQPRRDAEASVRPATADDMLDLCSEIVVKARIFESTMQSTVENARAIVADVNNIPAHVFVQRETASDRAARIARQMRKFGINLD